MKQKFLVTTALPYANGPIHLGHLLEGIQADIWVRFQKSILNECYFFCADDTHGTPVMIAAKKEGISPEELVNRIQSEHYRDLTGFLIEYNNYYSTNSLENKFYSEDIYNKLKAKGHIAKKDIEQSYCKKDQMFLPDRFIRGTCPKCKSIDQYGDGCEVCGSNYSPKDLLDSKCAICGTPPILKHSTHLFFKLPELQDKLFEWINNPDHVHEGVKNKLLEWFHQGLQEWDISRDGPYFGFEIPGEKDKYFYVWMDAPIGYMASSGNFFAKDMKKFDEFWKTGEGKIIHFVGKDILYFHALFWPAMLMGADYKTPSTVNVHGFLTVNGEKMSKSRGTFIKASTYLKYLSPEHLRFYLAGKLSNGLEDLDLSFDDFVLKVNSDLVGNFINILSRVGTTILDKLDRRVGKISEEGYSLLKEIQSKESEIRSAYSDKNYSKVMKEIAKAGDIVNKYINDKTPWNLIKTDIEKTREVVTNALNCAKVIAIFLYPVLPHISKKVFSFLNENAEISFSEIHSVVENRIISKYEILTNRVDEKAIQAMIEESKQTTQTTSTKTEKPETGIGLIGINDLSKVELRVGQIKEANHVEGADKLINVKVDLGEKGIKNIFAGIKSSYKPEDLIGLKVVVVANLEPRKMKFGVSEAMLLASGKDESLSLFVPHREANPGDLLK
ncbi:MAG: methionine--tRNA ligase [Leptospiraceae bacterium]|nr:methionine--tRNA ligase [Leptospiraceae bacterium]MCK6380361.1 methionine--tRNA ligase [Leptospiraceae bacterium]NUM41302.1 methionine--tRNA ligase [Leptospiraceae bacterium]